MSTNRLINFFNELIVYAIKTVTNLTQWICHVMSKFEIFLEFVFSLHKVLFFRVTPRRDTADEDDFDSTPKDVTFQPGETGPKYVNIDLVDDTDYEPTEKFTVSLSSNSRVVLGGPSTVNIQDDDRKYLSFLIS